MSYYPQQNQQYPQQQQPAYGQPIAPAPYNYPPGTQQASYGAVASPIPAHQDHAQYGPYPTPPPHQASFAAPTSHPPTSFPPGPAYGGPPQGYAPQPPQAVPQPIYAGGYAATPGPAYPAAPAAHYSAQTAYYPAPVTNFAQQPQQYAYGQLQASPGYGAPAAPPSFGAFVPRTYLGAPMHPSENPLLPPNEVVGSHIAVDGYDPSLMAREVEVIRKATKGFGTDQTALINVLVSIPPLRLPPLAAAYRQTNSKDLLPLLEKELTGNLEQLLMCRVRGPLGADAYWIDKAITGLGTNDALLTDLVIGRPPASLSLLRAYFTKHKNKPFNNFILDDLSLKTRTCFEIALTAVWSDLPDQGNGPETSAGFCMGYGVAPPMANEQLVQSDMRSMETAIKAKGTSLASVDPIALAKIVFCRSPVHLNRLQQLYLLTRRTSMTRDVKKGVKGHLAKALLYALEGGKKDTNGCWRDAKMLHKTMEGAGTKDLLLIVRLLRAHWDKARFAQVQAAYLTKYQITLKEQVRKDTSGHYRDALLALFNP